MDNRFLISLDNGLNFFYFEKLYATSSLEGFCCSVPEYNEELYSKNRKTISMRKDIYC
jgi:hypothetical protein